MSLLQVRGFKMNNYAIDDANVKYLDYASVCEYNIGYPGGYQ